VSAHRDIAVGGVLDPVDRGPPLGLGGPTSANNLLGNRAIAVVLAAGSLLRFKMNQRSESVG
jgi:hypothetical protein